MLSDRDHAAVERALELTSTSHFRHRLLDSLSGGERQRVWIALALAQEPRILLLDEPTTFLDINHQIQVLNLIQALNRERGLTVVMALHDLNQASQYAERLVVLSGGRIVEEGPPTEVIREEALASVFNVRAHISVSPVNGALLCYPYAAIPGRGRRRGRGVRRPHAVSVSAPHRRSPFRSHSLSARMWAGLVPQQPPIIRAPRSLQPLAYSRYCCGPGALAFGVGRL